MIVVDVETTGIDEVKHAILSVGAIDFEHPENQFYEECRVFDGAHIDDEGLAVNGFSREQALSKSKQTDGDLIKHFLIWALQCEEQTFAGQNPSFDRDFLRRAAERYSLNWPFAFRTIDQHSVCYAHMIKRGVVPPIVNRHSGLNSDNIMQYVGIPAEPHPHNALTGAKIAAEALSRLLYSKNLLPEFEDYPIPFES